MKPMYTMPQRIHEDQNPPSTTNISKNTQEGFSNPQIHTPDTHGLTLLEVCQQSLVTPVLKTIKLYMMRSCRYKMNSILFMWTLLILYPFVPKNATREESEVPWVDKKQTMCHIAID